MDSWLRQVLSEASHEVVVVPGCHDALSARLAESLGFPAVYLAGWTLGAILGTGESRMGLSDVLVRTNEIRRSSSIPMVVDAGAGYGDPQYTAAAAQAAGASAIHIEDQAYPKRAEYLKGVEYIVPADEMLSRLGEALKGRGDGPMSVIARTDAIRASGSLSEAARRANLLLEHGADAVMAMAYEPTDIKRLPILVDGPLVYAAAEGLRPMYSADELWRLGYRVMIVPLSAFGEAYIVAKRILESLRETGHPGTDPAAGQKAREEIQMILGLM